MTTQALGTCLNFSAPHAYDPMLCEHWEPLPQRHTPPAPQPAKELSDRERVLAVCPKAHAIGLADGDFAIHSGTDFWLCPCGSWAAALYNMQMNADAAAKISRQENQVSATPPTHGFCNHCHLALSNTTAGLSECPVCHGPIVSSLSSSRLPDPQPEPARIVIPKFCPVHGGMACYCAPPQPEQKELKPKINVASELIWKLSDWLIANLPIGVAIRVGETPVDAAIRIMSLAPHPSPESAPDEVSEQSIAGEPDSKD